LTKQVTNTEIQVSAGAPISTPPVQRVSPAVNLFHQSTSTIVPYLSHGAQRIGRLGVVGVSLCVFSVIAFLSNNVPLREQLQYQSDALETARTAAAQQHNPGVAQSPRQQAAGFFDSLPTRIEMPQVMAKIVAVSVAAGIELERGDYEYVPPDSGSIARYQLTLPVRGSYPQVRQFIEGTLTAVPAMALDSMRVERSKVSDQVIAADLQFSVMLGGDL
jgi:hypothetical protein